MTPVSWHSSISGVIFYSWFYCLYKNRILLLGKEENILKKVLSAFNYVIKLLSELRRTTII